MKSEEPLSGVIVGAGVMGRWHADAVVRAGARVVAVVDADIGRARALARRHSGCRAATEFDGAVKRGPLVVHVCTPTATHDGLVQLALEAGCHVLVEKPLAASLSSTERLLGLAAAKSLLLCPVHQFLFQRGVLHVCRIRAELGAIRHVDFVTCSAGASAGPTGAADAVAFEILPHPFALFARVLQGRFDELAWDVAHVAPGELRAAGHGAGMSAGILVSMGGRPTVNLFRVIGEKATAHADLFHGFAIVEHGAVSRAHKMLRPFSVSTRQLAAAGVNLARRLARREAAYPGLRELIKRFYGAAARGEEAPIAPAETLAVAGALDRFTGARRRG